MYVAKSENFRYIGMPQEHQIPMYPKKEYIGTPQKQTIPMYLPLQIHQIKQSLELHSPTKSTQNKDRYKYTEVPSEYSVYE